MIDTSTIAVFAVAAWTILVTHVAVDARKRAQRAIDVALLLQEADKAHKNGSAS